MGSLHGVERKDMSGKRDSKSEAPDAPAGGEGAGERAAAGDEAGPRTAKDGLDDDERAARAVRLQQIDAGVPVIELLDVTADAARLGFRCPIALFPEVLEECELASVLLGLRTALVGAAGDPATARMFGVAFGVASEANTPEPLLLVDHKRPGELARTILTLYGGMVVFQVAGSEGAVDIICRPWSRGRMLVLRRLGDLAPGITGDERGAASMLGARMPLALDVGAARSILAGSAAPKRPDDATVDETLGRTVAPADLFVVHSGRHHQVKRPRFVIGRDPRSVDLVINDDQVSPNHAAVIYRGDAYYIEDLDSTHGVTYRGLRIGNKRIDEGDVFELGAHELRFTYLEDG